MKFECMSKCHHLLMKLLWDSRTYVKACSVCWFVAIWGVSHMKIFAIGCGCNFAEKTISPMSKSRQSQGADLLSHWMWMFHIPFNASVTIRPSFLLFSVWKLYQDAMLNVRTDSMSHRYAIIRIPREMLKLRCRAFLWTLSACCV